MEFQELISGVRDVASVKRVYGDPYEKNGLTVIPAATVRTGGGGGMGNEQGGDSGGGGGFGLVARPSGAWIIEDGNATWRPAIDVNRVIMGGQAVALTAILVTGRVLLSHTRRRHSLLDLAALASLVSRVPLRRRARRRLPNLARPW